MMYLTIIRLLLPIWLLGAFALFIVALSHLIFSNFDQDSENSKLSLFGIRIFCAFFWPFILISAPGRRFMIAGIKGLLK